MLTDEQINEIVRILPYSGDGDYTHLEPIQKFSHLRIKIHDCGQMKLKGHDDQDFNAYVYALYIDTYWGMIYQIGIIDVALVELVKPETRNKFVNQELMGYAEAMEHALRHKIMEEEIS